MLYELVEEETHNTKKKHLGRKKKLNKGNVIILFLNYFILKFILSSPTKTYFDLSKMI